MITPTCHPDRKHAAHGMCRRCYYRERWLRVGPEVNARLRAERRADPEAVRKYDRLRMRLLRSSRRAA